MSSGRAVILGRGRALFLFVLLLPGCGGERAALLRGQGYYADNQFERALSVWRDLERHELSLPPSDFARYAYLRGMTDYRLGFHADARHWLALAKVSEQQHPGGLEGAWLPRLDGALADLDRETLGIPVGNADSVQAIDAPAAVPSPAPPSPAPPSPTPPSPTPPPSAPAALPPAPVP